MILVNTITDQSQPIDDSNNFFHNINLFVTSLLSGIALFLALAPLSNSVSTLNTASSGVNTLIAAADDIKKIAQEFSPDNKVEPKDANAYHIRARARVKARDIKGAIADYKEAIRLNPRSAQIYFNRGVTCGESGESKGAIADYTEAIKINPEFARAYYNRGLVRSLT